MEPTANQQQQPPVVNNTTPPKKSNILLIVIIVIIIFLGVGLLAGYFLANSTKQQTPKTTSPTSSVTLPPPSPTSPITPVNTIIPITTPQNGKPGWSTYKNDQYGFEISYPATYKVLTDSNNLYGWPNGIALLYKGGQSYDIAIQVWDSQEEYESAYPAAGENLTVKKTGTKFITIMDNTNDPENSEVITTFKLTD